MFEGTKFPNPKDTHVEWAGTKNLKTFCENWPTLKNNLLGAPKSCRFLFTRKFTHLC